MTFIDAVNFDCDVIFNTFLFSVLFPVFNSFEENESRAWWTELHKHSKPAGRNCRTKPPDETAGRNRRTKPPDETAGRSRRTKIAGPVSQTIFAVNQVHSFQSNICTDPLLYSIQCFLVASWGMSLENIFKNWRLSLRWNINLEGFCLTSFQLSLFLHPYLAHN